MRLMTSAPYSICELYFAAASRVTRGAEVHQVPDHRRGPHVERQPVIPVGGVALLHVEDLFDVVPQAHRRRDAAVPLPCPRGSVHLSRAEHFRQLPGDLQAHLQRPGTLLGHRLQQPLLVCGRIVEAGLGQHKKQLFDDRI